MSEALRAYAAELLLDEVPELDEVPVLDDFVSEDDDVVEESEEDVDGFDDAGALLDEEPRLSLR